MLKPLRDLIPLLLFGALLLARDFVFQASAKSGVGTVALLAAFGILGVLALRGLLVSVFRLEHARGFFRKLTLLVLSTCVCGLLLEAGLAGIEQAAAKRSKGAEEVMPPDWAKRPVTIPGTLNANYWQGELHVYNKDRMRWSSPIPDRTPGVCRIAAVGDSMTYGQGVNATNAWPAVLERQLQREGFRVEVLNLGVPGAQSEYVRNVVGEFVPALKPDLVVYGICLNDFLENGRRTYTNSICAEIPLPTDWKKFVFERTRTGRFLSSGYNGLLMAVGIRKDFYSDILADIRHRQKRFARDLKMMNEFVVATNLPPMVAMVLDQSPVSDGKGFQLAQTAEAAAVKAGMDVIPTSEYYKKYSGRRMEVSQWENHPSAEAYSIFADMIAKHVATNPALAPFRIAR